MIIYLLPGKREDGGVDLQSLEHDERRLVLHDRVSPAAGHLRDTVHEFPSAHVPNNNRNETRKTRGNSPVDTPNQDPSIRASHRIAEHPKLAIVPGSQGGGRRLAARNPLPDPPTVIRAHEPEEAQDSGLQRDAGDDDAVAVQQQLRLVVAGGGGERAADGLQDQAGDVGGHEDERVQAGAEARERRVDRERDVLEREVDRDADERGREDDGADLRLEGVRVPGVLVQEHARDVAWIATVS